MSYFFLYKFLDKEDGAFWKSEKDHGVGSAAKAAARFVWGLSIRPKSLPQKSHGVTGWNHRNETQAQNHDTSDWPGISIKFFHCFLEFYISYVIWSRNFKYQYIFKFKEEISNKEAALVKVNLEHTRIEKEKESLRGELQRMKISQADSRSTINGMEKEISNLQQVIREADTERYVKISTFKTLTQLSA